MDSVLILVRGRLTAEPGPSNRRYRAAPQRRAVQSEPSRPQTPLPLRAAGLLAFAGLTSIMAMPARAADPAIEITQAWARATPANVKIGGAYVTIVNRGTVDDQLTGASSQVAARTELHTTLTEDGVMKMRPLAEVPVPAGATVTFKPGAMHVMLLELKQPLKVGDSFPLTLTFAKAGTVEATVTVVKAGAADGGDAHAKPGMKM